MCGNNSANKRREELLAWGQVDLASFVDYTLALQAEVERLHDTAAQNSTNSSLAPSTDREPPKPQSLRRKSGRKPGGQPGHPGHTLSFSPNPQHTHIHPLLECPCGEDLSQQRAIDFERRQVFDLPALELACPEHRAQIKECPGCGQIVTARFPEDVKAPVQ